MKPTVLFTALLSLTGCLATYQHPTLVTREPAVAAGVLFRDVRVFPATSEAALEHHDVFVKDGRIVFVQPTGAASPDGASVIDGAGKTLLPGFVDAHGHLTGTAAAPWNLTWPDPDHTGQSYLYCGVTSVYDVAGDLGELVTLRARETKGQWVGPRFTYSGQMVTPPNGYPASMIRDLFSWPVSSIAVGHFATEVSDLADIDAAVQLRQDQGADHVKVGVAQIPLGSAIFDAALLTAVVDAAHKRSMRVVAHVDTEAHALMAARAGVDVLAHLVQLGPLSAEVARELADRHVSVALTLVAFERMEQIQKLHYAPTDIEREMNSDAQLAQYSPEVVRTHHVAPGMSEWIEALESSHDQRLANVKQLLDAGVNVVAGSDSEGSAATWAGGAYLEELVLMGKAGIPAAQVLLAATSRPAHLMQADPDFGTIEPGKRADLVLVDGNPLEDLDLGPHIARVMQGGQLLARTPRAHAPLVAAAP